MYKIYLLLMANVVNRDAHTSITVKHYDMTLGPRSCAALDVYIYRGIYTMYMVLYMYIYGSAIVFERIAGK